MPYQVHLVLLVIGDTGSCYVSRVEELSFAPYPGLRILFDDGEEGEELVEVMWKAREHQFVAALQPWDDRHFPFEEQLALLKAHGWQVNAKSVRRKT